jgi:hypothetical protein
MGRKSQSTVVIATARVAKAPAGLSALSRALLPKHVQHCLHDLVTRKAARCRLSLIRRRPKAMNQAQRDRDGDEEQ